MRVPFNDLRRLATLYGDEIEANVGRTIRTGWWLNGEQVGGFAGEFAQAVGVAHLAVLLCPQRDRLREHLAEAGIATDIHYPILDCDQSGWTSLPRRIDPAGLPVSRQSVGRLLSLPCFVGMTGEEIDAVCGALAAFSGT